MFHALLFIVHNERVILRLLYQPQTSTESVSQLQRGRPFGKKPVSEDDFGELQLKQLHQDLSQIYTHVINFKRKREAKTEWTWIQFIHERGVLVKQAVSTLIHTADESSCWS